MISYFISKNYMLLALWLLTIFCVHASNRLLLLFAHILKVISFLFGKFVLFRWLLRFCCSYCHTQHWLTAVNNYKEAFLNWTYRLWTAIAWQYIYQDVVSTAWITPFIMKHIKKWTPVQMPILYRKLRYTCGKNVHLHKIYS